MKKIICLAVLLLCFCVSHASDPEFSIYREVKGFPNLIINIAVDPYHRYVAVADNKKQVYVYDIKNDKLLQNIQGFAGNMRAMSFSPDGKYLAGIYQPGYDAQMIMMSTADAATKPMGVKQPAVEIPDYRPEKLKFFKFPYAEDAGYFAAVGTNYYINFAAIDSKTGSPRMTGKFTARTGAEFGTITGLDFSTDRKHFATGGNGSKNNTGDNVCIWQTRRIKTDYLSTEPSPERVKPDLVLEKGYGPLSFNPDGESIAVCSKYGNSIYIYKYKLYSKKVTDRLKIKDMKYDEQAYELKQEELRSIDTGGDIDTIGYLPGALDSLVVGLKGKEAPIKIVNTKTGKETSVISGTGLYYKPFAYSDSGYLFAYAFHDEVEGVYGIRVLARKE
jgi:WD40 repeat protein